MERKIRETNISENISTDSNPDFASGKTNILRRLWTHISVEREVWIVGAIALAIYLPAIWWGLPYATSQLGVHGWDVDAVTGMQTLSELHNLFFASKQDWWLAYPLFHYVVVGIFYAPYFLFLYLTGGITQITSEYPYGLRDPVTVLRNLALIGKMITVLMASGVVVNAYLAARTVWDKRTARLAAIAAALSTPMFYYGRTGNLDVPVLFWMSLTILFLAKCLTLGFTVRRAVWLGTFAALSVATKDQAFGALTAGLIMLVAIHIWRGIPNANSPEKISRWKPILALGVTGLVVYALANGLPINPHRFFAHIWFVRNFENTFYNVVHLDILRPTTPLGYATLTLDAFKELFIAIGPILFVIGIVGLIMTWRSSTFTKILFVMLIGHIVLVIFPIRHMQFRYAMFPALVFAFFIARALSVGLQDQRKWVAAGTLVIMVIGFSWVGLRDIDLTYQMIFDARYEASRWLTQNAKAGDKVAFFTAQNIIPPLEKETVPVKLLDDPSALEKLKEGNIRYVLAQPDFSSNIGAERSHFFPESIYKQVNDESLGYKNVASFETRPLFSGFFLDLPLVTPGYIINPPVKIYELKTESTGLAR